MHNSSFDFFLFFLDLYLAVLNTRYNHLVISHHCRLVEVVTALTSLFSLVYTEEDYFCHRRYGCLRIMVGAREGDEHEKTNEDLD